jgi:hypothetical protein
MKASYFRQNRAKTDIVSVILIVFGSVDIPVWSCYIESKFRVLAQFHEGKTTVYTLGIEDGNVLGIALCRESGTVETR